MKFPGMKFIREKIQQVLAPPVYIGDLIKTYRADLTHALILVSAGFIFILFIGNMLGGRISYFTQVLNILSFITCVVMYLLMRRGWIRFVGQAIILMGIALLTLSIASLGTIRVPSTIIYLFWVIIAGLLFEYRAVLITAVFSSLAILGLIVAENFEVLPAPDYTVNISQWVTYTLFFLVSGGFTLYVTRATKGAFARANRELAERKQAEEALSEFQSRLHLLSQNLEDAGLYVYSHDAAGKPSFEYMSAGMEALTGVQMEDALRNAGTVHSTILPEYVVSLMELEAKSKRELMGFEMEFRQRHAKSGEVRWMLLRSTPRQRQDGSTVWYGVQMDITERKRNEKLLEDANYQLNLRVAEIEKLQAELSEQAIRDPLTGLYNRRYMQDAFAREFARAIRENHPISVIMLDMDELKWLNDMHGHHVGDRALQTFASCLKTMIRTEDIVCRYGGDEFTVVMSGTGIDDAVRRIEEWRAFLARNHLVIKEEDRIQIKFTAGIASFPVHGRTLEEMLHYSDVALYRAKARGRNCTAVFD